MWHGIFAGSHFCEFSNGLQKLITANIFPGKIYFTVNILLLKLATKNTVLRNCLFNYKLSEHM